MTVTEALTFVSVIVAVPLSGVAVLVLVAIYCKPEKQRKTEELTYLSSKYTVFLKRRLPIIACPIVAVVTTAFAIKTFPSLPIEFRIIETILMLIACLIFFRFHSLKEVGYGDGYLYVSNISSSIRVAFRDIEKVSARYVVRAGWYIFVSFKNKTKYGKEIYFLPYKGDACGIDHPILIELNDAIQKNTNSETKDITLTQQNIHRAD